MIENKEHINTSRRTKLNCIHYWVIDDPTEPTSRGICRFCGAEREFINYMPYRLWRDNIDRS